MTIKDSLKEISKIKEVIIRNPTIINSLSKILGFEKSLEEPYHIGLFSYNIIGASKEESQEIGRIFKGHLLPSSSGIIKLNNLSFQTEIRKNLLGILKRPSIFIISLYDSSAIKEKNETEWYVNPLPYTFLVNDNKDNILSHRSDFEFILDEMKKNSVSSLAKIYIDYLNEFKIGRLSYAKKEGFLCKYEDGNWNEITIEDKRVKKYLFRPPSFLEKFDEIKKIWIQYSSNINPFTLSTLPTFMGMGLNIYVKNELEKYSKYTKKTIELLTKIKNSENEYFNYIFPAFKGISSKEASKRYNTALSPQGAVVIYSQEIDDEGILLLRNWTELIFDILGSLLFSLHIKKEADTAKKLALISARAAIMARNMSHNLGSHVLVNIPGKDIKDKHEDMQRLNSYIQQRMDFTAAVTSEWPEWSEPLFFFSDLLISGFFTQGFLLNYLIKDDGYGAEKIIFHIKRPESEKFISFVYVEGKINGRTDEIDRFKAIFESPPFIPPNVTKFGIESRGRDALSYSDFLVSIPGGVVGRQAFYAFMENALRNASKYNKRASDGSLQVFIEISEPGECDTSGNKFYEFTYYDNISKNLPTGESGYSEVMLVENIQNKINKSLIMETGDLNPGDWGIQEMKVCIDFLNYPKGKQIQDRHYLWAETKELPDKFEVDDGNEVLSYRFYIQKARLILIFDDEYVGNYMGNSNDVSHEHYGVFFEMNTHESEVWMKSVKEFSPQMLLFKVDNSNLEDILTFIKDNYKYLPARILLACDHNGLSIDQVESKINECTKESHFPKRRIFMGKMPAYPSKENGRTWEHFVVDVFKEWIYTAFELQNKPMNIMIYFQRNQNFPGLSQWDILRSSIKNYGLEFLGIHLYYDVGNDQMGLGFYQERDKIENVGTESTDNSLKWLFFDNHGNIRDTIREKIEINEDFYQVIGGDTQYCSNNFSIFDQFHNVPQDFAGAFFLLLLIESCFSRILIIDERFSENLKKGQINGKLTLRESKVETINKANIYNCFSFNYVNNGKVMRKFLIESDKFTGILGEEDSNLNNLEGILLNDKSRIDSLRIFNKSMGKLKLENNSGFDTIVIHQGWLDKQKKDKEISLNIEEFLKSLADFTSRIIITSGRGRTPDIVQEFPFVEFSSIDKYLLKDFSKYHINKILMSARKDKEVTKNE